MGKEQISAVGFGSAQKSSVPEALVTWERSPVTGWGEGLCHSGPRGVTRGWGVFQPEAKEGVSVPWDRTWMACLCGGPSGRTGARGCVYLCTVLMELCLCFGFCSVSALKRKLKIPGTVKTSHSVGKWTMESARYVNEGVWKDTEGWWMLQKVCGKL